MLIYVYSYELTPIQYLNPLYPSWINQLSYIFILAHLFMGYVGLAYKVDKVTLKSNYLIELETIISNLKHDSLCTT